MDDVSCKVVYSRDLVVRVFKGSTREVSCSVEIEFEVALRDLYFVQDGLLPSYGRSMMAYMYGPRSKPRRYLIVELKAATLGHIFNPTAVITTHTRESFCVSRRQ